MMDNSPHFEEFLTDQFTVKDPYDRYTDIKGSE